MSRKKKTAYQKKLAKTNSKMRKRASLIVAPKLRKILKACNTAVALDSATYKHQKELEDFRLLVGKAYYQATQNDASLVDTVPGLRFLVNQADRLF